MTLGIQSVAQGEELLSGRAGLRRAAWCTAGVAGGVYLWLEPEAVLPAGALQSDLLRVVGQFTIFASMAGLVASLAGRALRMCVGRVSDRLGGMSETWFVLLVVGGGLAIRVLFALLFPDRLSSDAYWYHARAVDLLEGRGYVRPGPVVEGVRTFIPTAFWPVGYSAFLAGVYWITGVSWRIGIVVNALLSGASVLVLYRIGVAVLGRRAARLGGLLVCVSPVLWPRMLLSESLFTLLILVAVWLVLGRRVSVWGTVATGAVMAAAMYVKVNALPVAAVLALVWCVRLGRFVPALGHTVLCCSTMAAACAPWALRNLHRLDAFVPTTTSGGVALLMGAHDSADGREPSAYGGPVWEQVLRTRLDDFDEVRSDRLAGESARAWVSEHPARWAVLGCAKLLWMSLSQPWHPPFELFGQASRSAPIMEMGFKALCRAAGWLTLIGFAAYAVDYVSRGQGFRCAGRKLGWVPLAAWMVFALQAVVFVGYGRLRLPVEGLLILAGAYVLLRAGDARGFASRAGREGGLT